MTRRAGRCPTFPRWERGAAAALQQIHGVVAKIRGVCEQSVVSLTAIKDEQLRLANEKQVRERDRVVHCL